MKWNTQDRDPHAEVRQSIALGNDVSEAQQAQLRSHLEQCESCRQYAKQVSGVLSAIRSSPLAADARLVRATQMRVRFHAVRLREARQRMWIMAMACLGVGLSATLTVPYLWRLFAWLGEWAELPPLVWQAGFVIFFITPAVLAGISIVVRGARLTNEGER